MNISEFVHRFHNEIKEHHPQFNRLTTLIPIKESQHEVRVQDINIDNYYDRYLLMPTATKIVKSDGIKNAMWRVYGSFVDDPHNRGYDVTEVSIVHQDVSVHTRTIQIKRCYIGAYIGEDVVRFSMGYDNYTDVLYVHVYSSHVLS